MQFIPRLPNEPAHDFALRALRYNIVNLHFLPGAFISCHDLAGKMGISRTPLREAMQELHRIGLLTVYANAGSQISLIDCSKLNELRFMRRTMELSAVEAICDRIRPEDYFSFEEMLLTQQNCLRAGQAGQLMELDDRFHAYIYQLVDMSAIFKIISSFQCHFERFRQLNFSAQQDLRMVDEHKDLFEAFKKHNKRAAKKIITFHFSCSRKEEMEIIGRYAGYFTNYDSSDRAPASNWHSPTATRGSFLKQLEPKQA